MELVGAVRGEYQDRLGAQVAHEVGEEIAARAVGPVEVLDHQQQGDLGGDAQQVREDGLEQAGPGERLLSVECGRCRCGGGGSQRRHQAPELGTRGWGEGVQRGCRVVACLARCRQRPEELRERRVGQAATGDRHTATRGGHPCLDGPREVLPKQAGLADARVAADQEQPRLAPGGTLPRRVEQVELGMTSDERGGRIARHVLKHSHRVPRSERLIVVSGQLAASACWMEGSS